VSDGPAFGDHGRDGDATRPLSDVSVDEEAVWAMVDAAPDGLLIVDEDGAIELVNQGAEILFGYDRGELLGRPVETLLPDGLRAVHRGHRTRYRAVPQARPMGSGLDLVARSADGREVPVEVSLSPLRFGGRLRVLAAVRDISDRLAAEAETTRIRRAIDAVADGVYLVDPDTMRFVYANRGAADQTGFTVEELTSGMTPSMFAADLTDSELTAVFARVRQGDEALLRLDTTWRPRSGADRQVEAVVEYPRTTGPLPPVFVLVVRDRSDQVEAEDRLRASETRFRATFDHGPVAILVGDLSNDQPMIVDANRAASRLYGRTREELIGQPGPSFFHPDDRGSIDELAKALRAGRTGDPAPPVRVVRPDEGIVWVQLHLAPLTGQSGEPMAIAHLVDITAEVEGEATRARQEALQRAVSEIRLNSLQGVGRREGLTSICRAAIDVLDASTAVVYTPAHVGADELEIEAAIGLPDDVGQALRVSRTAGLVGEVYRSGQVICVGADDLRILEHNRRAIENQPSGSIVLAPLNGRDGVIGLLVVARRPRAVALSDDDLLAITRFANEAVLAIELVAHRQVRQRMELLDDRERIARDMHDMVIGRLFATGMKLQATLQAPGLALTRSRIEQAVTEIDTTITEIRSTILGLRSTVDWGRGTRGEILAVAADHAPGLGFEPVVDLHGPIDQLPPPVVGVLLAVLRESLTNVTKHAEAKRVRVEVAVADGRVTMTVEDDGVGMVDTDRDPAAGRDLTGQGLGNMGERARRLGGQLDVRSEPGRGTVVSWSSPIGASGPDPDGQ
jgi:PAS domain S-box-containing protein